LDDFKKINYTTMNLFPLKRLLILLLSIVMLIGCASKRYAKKGAEFEKAGLYEKAAEMYYISVTKNKKNLEAQVGLRKTGQITLDNKLEAFMGHYNADDIKDAVYIYLELNTFYEKVKTTGIDLSFPRSYADHYQEVKTLYLDARYQDAYLLLEQEKFSESEAILNEILTLEPGFKDAQELKNTAHFEPIYRKAKELLDIQKYRSSYLKFQEILKKQANYKDARELSELALTNALITIAVVDFSNTTKQKGIETMLQSCIEKNISTLKTPFIKLVDRENIKDITQEQLLTLEGKVDGNIQAKAGKMLGVKALLTGQVNYYGATTGELEKTEKKGYVKKVIKVKTKEGEKDSTLYEKTRYFEYKQENSVTCHFQYKLISTETGEVLVTDAISHETSDEVHYAAYDGDRDNLIPGYWESKDKKSSLDVINDSASDKRKLKELLEERRQLKSLDAMSIDVQQVIANKVGLKIEQYDPER